MDGGEISLNCGLKQPARGSQISGVDLVQSNLDRSGHSTHNNKNLNVVFFPSPSSQPDINVKNKSNSPREYDLHINIFLTTTIKFECHVCLNKKNACWISD